MLYVLTLRLLTSIVNGITITELGLHPTPVSCAGMARHAGRGAAWGTSVSLDGEHDRRMHRSDFIEQASNDLQRSRDNDQGRRLAVECHSNGLWRLGYAVPRSAGAWSPGRFPDGWAIVDWLDRGPGDGPCQWDLQAEILATVDGECAALLPVAVEGERVKQPAEAAARVARWSTRVAHPPRRGIGVARWAGFGGRAAPREQFATSVAVGPTPSTTGLGHTPRSHRDCTERRHPLLDLRGRDAERRCNGRDRRGSQQGYLRPTPRKGKRYRSTPSVTPAVRHPTVDRRTRTDRAEWGRRKGTRVAVLPPPRRQAYPRHPLPQLGEESRLQLPDPPVQQGVGLVDYSQLI